MRRESHRAAGVVVFREDGRGREYLLLRSSQTRTPMWEFPKGGVEAGESEAEAAERELNEETGLAPEEYDLCAGFREEERYLFTLGRGGRRTLVTKRVVYYLARSATARVRISREATEFRWVPYGEARRLLRIAAKQEVLDCAERWLCGGGDGVTG